MRPVSAYAGAGGAAPPSLDTEALTQRGAPREKHNSTTVENRSEKSALHPAYVAGRELWLGQVELLTWPARQRKALALLERGREVQRERYAQWTESGLVARDEVGRPLASMPGAPLTPAPASSPSSSVKRTRPRERVDPVAEWHRSRAEGKRSLFQRVRACPEERRSIVLTCRGPGCSHTCEFPIGCASNFFCASCRKRTGDRFRVDFERKRQGITSAAARAGLMTRRRRRAVGGRFSERLVTLTVPHEGNPAERLELARRGWERFWRLMSDELRPELSKIRAGILSYDDETGEVLRKPKRGRGARRARAAHGISPDELTLWDLVQYLWVREWTPGEDGLGHPHFHVWLFSPFLAHWRVQQLWTRALADVLGGRAVVLGELRAGAHRGAAVPVVFVRDKRNRWRRSFAQHDGRAMLVRDGRAPFVPVVDVRAAWELERDGSTVGHELVKYLTKEWEVTDDGVRRAAPEVFAQVFNATDGTRQRQSSAGLSQWAAAKFSVCPECGHSAEVGCYARVTVRDNVERERAELERERLTVCDGGAPERRPEPDPGAFERWQREVLAALDVDDPRAVALLELLELPGIGRDAARAHREYWEGRDRQWLDSLELRVLEARWRAAHPELAKTRPVEVREQGELFSGSVTTVPRKARRRR